MFPNNRTLKLFALLAVCIALRTPAEGATLAQLFAGDSIVAGNSRFSNWELLEMDSTSGANPLLSQIFVTPIAGDLTTPGLLYSTSGHLATAGINAVDMQFKFRVSTLSGGKAFAGQSLSLSGITMGGPSGLAVISQENASLTGGNLGATLVMADEGTDFVQSTDLEAFPHHFAISVTTSVFLTGLSGTDSVSLSSFFQLFAQSGPQNLPGDFDFDGDVDGRDFLVWQRGGSPTPLGGSDLNDWKFNYGTSSALSASIASVPEPAAAALLSIALVSTVFRPKAR